MSLLKELNDRYVQLHTPKEDAFWAAKMRTKAYAPGDFEAKEVALKQFISDSTWLPKIKAELAKTDLAADEKIGLEGWRHFFEVNIVESDEARALQHKLIEMEGELDRKRRALPLGYLNPLTGEIVVAGTDKLRLTLATAKEDKVRKAAWEGLASIEPFVLKNGFIEIVKERNRLARMLGYEDYYDYRVTLNEGFSKEKLFEILDDLEANTRQACLSAVQRVTKSHGDKARDPWNIEFFISGDLTAKLDPYFPFEQALVRWGKSFAALGVSYGDAEVVVDLLARPGKEENGFMHGPFPGYVDDGQFIPARIQFTANAIPRQMGSGLRALATLFHEGGHAAHFGNIRMPAPCFSQEFAPSSVAFAETQSMFMDHFVQDPDWRLRYARTPDGMEIPLDLICDAEGREHAVLSYRLRSLLVVPYAEKAIYEMADEDLTPENILKRVREVEKHILPLNGNVRPVLSVPHLLHGESSAYYHGYVLAQMAVYQTRDYFFKKYGYLLDNVDVGREMAEKYWRPGNSRTFLELVQDLTGEPFSAKATVELVNRTHSEVLERAEQSFEKERTIPRYAGPPDLEIRLTVAHGDQIIASSANGDTFDTICDKFAAWVRSAS